MVSFYDDSFAYITDIYWRFSDWGYYIQYCTHVDYSAKFPLSPPTDVDKTWEVTVTAEDIKIKCNSLEVLHYNFTNASDNRCQHDVKGRITAKVIFSHNDTATKMFKSEVGK